MTFSDLIKDPKDREEELAAIMRRREEIEKRRKEKEQKKLEKAIELLNEAEWNINSMCNLYEKCTGCPFEINNDCPIYLRTKLLKLIQSIEE